MNERRVLEMGELKDALPKYDGIQYVIEYNPEMFDYYVKAKKGDLEASLTVHKEHLYYNPDEVARRIERLFSQLCETMSRIQVDLSIKDGDEDTEL